MKALSIKQPWASLIAHGIKDIENRTWKTSFRGRIYIHASAKIVDEIQFNGKQNAELYEAELWNPDTGFSEALRVTSAIIGEVDIIDCVINHESIWAESSRFSITPNPLPFGEENDLNKPIYNWVLANAVLYHEPILNVKGKLSFWNYGK